MLISPLVLPAGQFNRANWPARCRAGSLDQSPLSLDQGTRKRVDLVLFERSKSGMHFTPAGERLLNGSQWVLPQIHDAAERT